MENPHLIPKTIVDVFEEFFGDSIARLNRSSLEALPANQRVDLGERVDDFLEEAADHDFRDDAVVLDCLANPFMVTDDPTAPKTTRKAKQVALLHETVIIPQITQYAVCDEHPSLESLLDWSRANEKLLTEHVLALASNPDVFDLVSPEQLEELSEVVEKFLLNDAQDDLRKILNLDEISLSGGQLTRREAIENAMVCALVDAANPGSLGTNSTFLDSDSSEFLEMLVNIGAAGVESAPVQKHKVLEAIDLPMIAQIQDEDFVEIRLQSEDFGEFRSALSRVLEKTGDDSNAPPSEAFKSNLDEIRWRAELLRRDIKDQTLLKYLANKWQGYAVGALASTSVAVTKSAFGGGIDPTLLGVGAGASALFNTVFSILQFTPSHRKRRLLRFYSTLLDENAEK